MTDVNIATGAEQPINADGAVSTVTGSEGDLVGLNSDGELVEADAAADTAVPAIGVLATPVRDPSNYPDDDEFEFAVTIAKSQYVEINGRKVGYVRYGVELANDDEDWSFTQGEPVYLDTGGGFTQTKPSSVGALVQKVGVAINEGEDIFLDIEDEYSAVAENSGTATFDGTGSKTDFDIAHGLDSEPTNYNVEALSADADGGYHVAVDGTNITVKFGSAPSDDTDNVELHWYAAE